MTKNARYSVLIFVVFLLYSTAVSGNKRTKRNVEVIKSLFQSKGEVEYRVTAVTKRDDRMCDACVYMVDLVITTLQTNTDRETETAIYNICVGLQVMSEEVCRGFTSIFTPEIAFILRNSPGVSGISFCAVALQRYGCLDPNATDWTIDTDLGTKPRNPPSTKAAGDLFKVLHVTDLHYQPEYAPNGNANCGEYMCCRTQQENNTVVVGSMTARLLKDPTVGAGKWGDYRSCDMPYEALDNMFDHISTQHKDISMVLMTGDLPSHAVWDTSRSGNLDVVQNMTALIRKYFPNTPVFPSIGNHESHPVNCFPPPYVTPKERGSSWLLDGLAKEWSAWLPEDALSTLRRGGYYSVEAKPGLKIIGINNNVGYNYNWWLLYDTQYAKEQLEWLAGELLHAEAMASKVFILGHLPPGNEDMWKVWSREFARLINRFEYTVTGQFYGHTHTDEMSLFYDNSGKPTNVAFVGGSATTYSFLNPNYKLFFVDDNNFELLNMESWIFNLTDANLPNNKPKWRKLYSAREDFSTKSLSPHEIDDLVSRMVKDKTLMDKYHRYFVKDADPLLVDACNSTCQKSLLCSMRLSDVTHTEHCLQVVAKVDAEINRDVYTYPGDEVPTNEVQDSPQKPASSVAVKSIHIHSVCWFNVFILALLYFH